MINTAMITTQLDALLSTLHGLSNKSLQLPYELERGDI